MWCIKIDFIKLKILHYISGFNRNQLTPRALTLAKMAGILSTHDMESLISSAPNFANLADMFADKRYVNLPVHDVIDLIGSKLGRTNISILNEMLRNACTSCKYKIAKILITQGAQDLNSALICACEANDKMMAEMLIKKGATNASEEFIQACRSGDYMIAETLFCFTRADAAAGFLEACSNDQSYIALYLHKHVPCDLNAGLTAACRNWWGNMAAILVANGATNCSNCEDDLEDHNDYWFSSNERRRRIEQGMD